MSREPGPENPPQETPNTPPEERRAGGGADPTKLQRQTFVMVSDRGRFVLLVGLCTLAGVAVGFGLSTLASDRGDCEHVHHRASVVVPSVLPQLHVSPRANHSRHDCGKHRGVHIWDGDEGVHIWEDGDEFHFHARDDDDSGYLGVNISPANPGARVIHIASGSPAASAGIEIDDVIVAFEGLDIDLPGELVKLVRGAGAGDEVSLTVKRGDIQKTIAAALAELP
jgi:S1-C subfamily serine protease